MTPQTTFVLEYTQFMRPSGLQVQQYDSGAPIELEQPYLNIVEQPSLRLEAEMLMTNQVNFTITHEEFGDYDGFIVNNGPEVLEAIAGMLRRWNVDEYHEWLKEHELREQ